MNEIHFVSIQISNIIFKMTFEYILCKIFILRFSLTPATFVFFFIRFQKCRFRFDVATRLVSQMKFHQRCSSFQNIFFSFSTQCHRIDLPHWTFFQFFFFKKFPLFFVPVVIFAERRSFVRIEIVNRAIYLNKESRLRPKRIGHVKNLWTPKCEHHRWFRSMIRI